MTKFGVPDVSTCKMIITIKKSIRGWTELLAGDEVLATAILDACYIGYTLSKSRDAAMVA